MNVPSSCRQPPLTHNAEHKERRVGVEVELSGFDYSELVQLTADFLGGTATQKSRYVSEIDTADGTYTVELDSDPVKDMEAPDEDLPDPLKKLANRAMDLFDAAAERIVPLEIVGPPLPVSRIQIMEDLCEHLAQKGALGSRHAIHFAFGLQLNPELPSLDADTILRHMQAFAGLYPWLKERHQVDISRKFTVYIRPWPEAYVKLLMEDGYRPDLETLITDYIKHNPSRNRALDLMPLFMYLQPEQVKAQIDDERIKPRPTFHYRLPDCDLDQDQWQFAHIWNDWVALEELANDPQRLKQFRGRYREKRAFSLENLTHDWIDECSQWASGKTVA